MKPSTQSLRNNALSIFQTGIEAANPYQAVKKCLTVTENNFELTLDLNDKTKIRSGSWSKIHIIAFGKAACSMTQAAEKVIPVHRLASRPVTVTNYENVTTLDNIDVIGAAHPIPDLSGQKAAQSIVEKLKTTKKGELVLVLISGGGSALLPLPALGITLEDKQITTELLLASGADIKQINCVRKHLSQLKGGLLSKLAIPADLHALILSDVLDDDLTTIASGPTVPDDSTFSEAITILNDKDIWRKIPSTIRTLLEQGTSGKINETPKSDESFFNQTSYTLIGSNTISLKALIKTAKKLNYETDVYSAHLSGEARETAEKFLLYAKNHVENNLNQPIAILAGGETTVTLNGTGSGGRNQEMALAFAIAADKHQLKGNWTFLSAGTDGIDGPTDAAGGIVDSKTLERIKKALLNPENRLNNNDSYSALKKSNDLVITGATGTNVADLQVLLIQPE